MVERTKNAFEGSDDLLASLLTDPDQDRRERTIETLLIDHAKPVVARVLRRYRRSISVEDFDDLESLVNLRIVRRLRQTPPQEAIVNFDDYVAGITFNAIHDYWHARYPQWARMRSRVHYVLSHDPRFATWDSATGTVAGLTEWSGQKPRHFLEPAGTLPLVSSKDPQRTSKTIAAIFVRSGAPILLEDLLRLLADVWDINDQAATTSSESIDSIQPNTQFESQRYLAALWIEVRALRQPQRAALLLNLRDSTEKNALALLLLAGIATADEIADAIGITPERLSKIWNDLPLNDATIASLLGVTPQQVINLRKSARERLSRRMNSKPSRP